MPDRSFGRTVRYRRTKLGLSQAKLAELVGRTTPTIRSWERDKSRPNDHQVLSALAAILGIDESHLFDKAEVEHPEIETSPTVEQALATLTFEEEVAIEDKVSDEEPKPESEMPSESPSEREVSEMPSESPAEPELKPFRVAGQSEPKREQSPDVVPERERELVGVVNGPGYVAPPEPYQQTPLTPTLADTSYMEDNSQRQLYRVRTLATLVAIVALVIAFIWAVGEGIGALGAWWDGFFGQLRL